MTKSWNIFDKSIHLYSDNILLYRLGSLIKDINADDFDMTNINDYLFSIRLVKNELRKRDVPLIVLCVDNDYDEYNECDNYHPN